MNSKGLNHKEECKCNFCNGTNNGFKEGHATWNKGLTKETDERVIKYSSKLKGRQFSEEHRQNISKSKIRKNIRENNYFYGMEGESAPGWRGGTSFEPYTKEFNKKFKKAIRQRDNYICMLCNKHQEKLNRTLFVHHINYDKKLSIPQNCITLCNSCHQKTNFNEKHWIKLFQSLLNEKYKYNYSDDEKIILNLHGGLKNA